MATIEERAVRHREASLRYLAKPEAKARKKEYDRHRLETDPVAYARKLEVNRESMRKYRAAMTAEEKMTLAAYQTAYRKAHPEKVTKWNRKANLKGKYGLTLAAYSDLLVSQDGLCAVCYEEPAVHTDHDHASGVVRGLLCNNCNTGLGMFNDQPERLEGALLYLKGE